MRGGEGGPPGLHDCRGAAAEVAGMQGAPDRPMSACGFTWATISLRSCKRSGKGMHGAVREAAMPALVLLLWWVATSNCAAGRGAGRRRAQPTFMSGVPSSRAYRCLCSGSLSPRVVVMRPLLSTMKMRRRASSRSMPAVCSTGSMDACAG